MAQVEKVLVEIFTHRDPHTGEIRHFNATAMYTYATCHLTAGLRPTAPPGVEFLKVAVTEEHVRLVAQHRGVEKEHILRLVEEARRDQQVLAKLSMPMIAIHDVDDTTLTVDGHHRFMLWAAMGREFFHILRFRQGAWAGYLLNLAPEDEKRFVDDLPGTSGE